MAGKDLSDDELSAIMTQQIRLAKNHDRAMRATSRARSIEYYLGQMKDTPAEPNRSSVISRDVSDTIGWLLPQLMRVFDASDKVAVADPLLPEGLDGLPQDALDQVMQQAVEQASEATDGLNHVFMKENDGYRIMYNAMWDAMVVGNGIVKTYWDATPQFAISFHTGLTEDQIAQLLMPPDDEDAAEPEVLTGPTQSGTAQDETGQSVPIFDIKIKRQKAKGKFVVDCIAPEDFLIDGDAVLTADARLTAHREEITRSDLIAMGYDKADVDMIPRKGKLDQKEDIARDENDGGMAPDPSMDIVEYYECWARLDVDGDGEAELIRYCAAGPNGQQLLDWEVWEDESPFDDIPCEPIPHRWDARSVADETMDVMRVKTTLLRQALNNIYAVNNPQRQIEENSVTNMDELFTPSFGGVVIRKKGSAPIEPLEVPFVADHAFDAINYQDQVIQRRTGVSRQTMALDPQALTNQSATANQNEKDASYSQVEVLARHMANLGWKKVFSKLLRLMAKHQDSPRTLIVGGKARRIDPRSWNQDMNVNINVGLGTGSRDRDMQMLTQVLQQQLLMLQKLTEAGLSDEALELLPYVHTTLTKFAESGGLKNPELYYPPITRDLINQAKQKLAQMSQQPDPQMQIAQMKAQSDQQVAQMQTQSDQQVAQVKAQIDQQLAQAKLQEMSAKSQAEVQRAQADFQIQQVQAQADLQMQQLQAQMAQQKLELDAQLMGAKVQLEREKLEHGQAESAAKTQADMVKAAWSNVTSIEVARIGASQNTAPEPAPVEERLEQIVGVRTDGLIAEMHAMMGSMHGAITAPTEIVRDADGKAIGARKVINNG